MKANNPYGYKQPIITTAEALCGGDLFCATLFEKLILKASGRKAVVYIKDEPVPIERGDVIFGREKWAQYFGLKKSEQLRVYRKLVKLEKTLNLVSNRKYKNCTVVSIINYDQLVEVNNLVNKPRTNSEQTVNTSYYEYNEYNETESPEAIENKNQALSEETKEDREVLALTKRWDELRKGGA